MNKTVYLTTMLALVFSLSTTLPANEKASCEDLHDIIEALDDIADAVEDANEAELNKIDSDLSDLIDDLYDFARSEHNSRLKSLVRKLEKAYDAKDKDRFVDALDDVTDKVEAIKKADCK